MSTDDTPTVPVPDGVAESDLPRAGDLPTTRVRQGYKPKQVDTLIADVFEAVRSGTPAPSIADAKFDATRGVRKGYDEEAVDTYLDELSRAVGQGPTPEPGTRPEVLEKVEAEDATAPGADGGGTGLPPEGREPA